MNFKNNRILIVDDNSSIHEDYQKIFSNREIRENPSLKKLSLELFGESEKINSKEVKFELDFVFQGKEALEKVKQSLEKKMPYSMAFMDVRMPPGWDGIETIKQIWNVDNRIQMVICTAYSDYSWVEILENFENSESLLILKKPFESMEVLQLAYSLTTRWSLARQVELKGEGLESLIELRTKELNEKSLKLFEAEKMASIGILAGGVAHEFNNLNAIILGYADLSLMDKELKSTLKSNLEKIKVASLKGKDIAENLLILAGKDSDIKQKIRLNDLVTQSINLFQSYGNKESIVITTEIKDSLAILGDQRMLSQVIQNILKNAEESMIDTNSGQILVKIFAENNWAYITIEDQGIGIKSENLKNIFSPFYSTKGVYSIDGSKQSRYKGTGLGLSVCQAIIINHGGEIAVASKEKIGTTFTIKIPVTNN